MAASGRNETSRDQLQWVLAKMREIPIAHPRIDSDAIRVRFVAHGESALAIDIRVYAQATEWSDFYAIVEEVMLPVSEIAAKSGAGFAFPSRTFYVARDEGLDGEHATEEVARWRRQEVLPFPRLSARTQERMENRLAFPPFGSPELHQGEAAPLEGADPLSTGGGEDAAET